jgi:hypothetical protein
VHNMPDAVEKLIAAYKITILVLRNPACQKMAHAAACSTYL